MKTYTTMAVKWSVSFIVPSRDSQLEIVRAIVNLGIAILSDVISVVHTNEKGY